MTNPCRTTLDASELNPEETDLSLKFDSTNNKFQPIHLDLINSFGIFARPTRINSKKVSLEFMLSEIGSCKRYDISEVKLGNVRPEDVDEVDYCVAIKVVERDTERVPHKIKEFEFSNGDMIDVFIDSKIIEIVSPKDETSIYEIVGNTEGMTYWPPRYCKFKIQDMNGK